MRKPEIQEILKEALGRTNTANNDKRQSREIEGKIGNYKQENKIMTGIYQYLSVITISVKSLSSPGKKQRLGNQIKEESPMLSCIQKTFKPKTNLYTK